MHIDRRHARTFFSLSFWAKVTFWDEPARLVDLPKNSPMSRHVFSASRNRLDLSFWGKVYFIPSFPDESDVFLYVHHARHVTKLICTNHRGMKELRLNLGRGSGGTISPRLTAFAGSARFGDVAVAVGVASPSKLSKRIIHRAIRSRTDLSICPRQSQCPS
jgi:hypothetical protein